MMSLLVQGLIIGSALAGAPPDLLAPSAADLDSTFDRLEARLKQAAEADLKWSAEQRGWFDAGATLGRCQVRDCAERVVRLRKAAREARRFAQAARAEWRRVRRMVAFPPVQTLLRGPRKARWQRLGAAVQAAERRYVARLAWSRRFVESWAARNPRSVAQAECDARRTPVSSRTESPPGFAQAGPMR